MTIEQRAERLYDIIAAAPSHVRRAIIAELQNIENGMSLPKAIDTKEKE